MNSRSYRLLLALSLVQAFACGDDDSTDQQVQDAGPEVIGKVTDSGAPSDAGRSADASRPDAGSSSFDAGARDSGAARTDSGVVDSGVRVEDAGGTNASSAACKSCESHYCAYAHLTYSTEVFDLTKQCDMLTGDATDGPKKGMPRSKLCNELVACAQRTACAKGGAYQCLCGPGMTASDCVPMLGKVTELTGACRSEYLAAAGTTNASLLTQIISSSAEIVASSGATVTPAEYAAALLDCDRSYCIEECFGKVCEGAADGTLCGSSATEDPRQCKSGKCPVVETTYPAGPDAGL
ncbi:MAG TPA: hypothetical protein VI299_02855 [Polyangiales bacterium]